MLPKLRACRGETLTETLAAILIVSLTAVALMTMVVSAARINRTAGEEDKAFREEQIAAETQASGTTDAVTITGNRIGEYQYEVKRTGKDGALTSYAYEKEGGNS